MPKERDLNTDDPFPASWTDSIQELLSSMANFDVVALNATTIRGVAGAGDAQAGLTIGGRWRWRTANYDVAVPAGAAQVYDVWAYCSESTFSNTPVVDTDTTDRNWYLAIRTTAEGAPVGNTPAGNAIAFARKIWQVAWDGAAITGLIPLMSAPSHGYTHRAGGEDPLPSRAFRAAHSFLVPGQVSIASGDTDYIPPFVVPVAPDQAVQLVEAHVRLNNGSAANRAWVSVAVNGVVQSSIETPAGTGWALLTFAPAVPLADGDELSVAVTALSGTPKNLSVTLVLEHAV